MSEPENVYTQEATGLRACAHPASPPWSRSAEWMMMGRASARLGAGSAKSLTAVCVTSLGETAALLSCRTSAPSGEDVRAQRDHDHSCLGWIHSPLFQGPRVLGQVQVMGAVL